jgi:uncharacterized protein
VDIQFKHLIHLQDLDSEINKIILFLKQVPVRIKEIDNKIKQSQTIVTQTKEKLTQNQKKRRDLEAKVQDADVKIKKLLTQLNEVRTNKEYSTLLREIDESKFAKEKSEEQIITEMLNADEIETEIQEAEQQAAESEARLSMDKNHILEEKQKMETKRQKLQAEKNELKPKIPPEQLDLYLSIYEKNNGVALSPVTDDFCSICQIRIRPQMINELIAGDIIMLCENCGRILYWNGDSTHAEQKI